MAKLALREEAARIAAPQVPADAAVDRPEARSAKTRSAFGVKL
jgi:hypothetical protein